MQRRLDWRNAERVHEICMLAPTENLADKARAIIAMRDRAKVDVFSVYKSREEIAEFGRTVAKKGARIIISRKGSRKILEETTDITIVGMDITLTDYMQILTQLKSSAQGLIAFFSYDRLSNEILQMCQLLNIQAKNYIFKSHEQCWDCVRAAMSDGAVLGIGGAWTAPVSDELGFPHITVENSEESIVNALESAEQILQIQHQDSKKQRAIRTRMETYQAVLKFTHDAIMSIDEKCRIQVVNPVAEKIIGRSAEACIGKPIESILPNTKLPEVLHSGKKQINQMMKIGKITTITNRVPIEVDGQRRGVVATFQDIQQLQTSEQNIRLQLHEKGLVAKYTFEDILGESKTIKDTILIAKSYAASSAAVLIHGETGTGKELFAQSIHNASARNTGPFVAINCAAVNCDLLESELFGYEAGAFTGASKSGHKGLFELAHRGTIFLDEIGEISLETQVELLRVLQEKEVRRVGGNQVIPVDVRILTATNRDLIQEIIDGVFREDLYYRLNVLDLKIPPLRERGNDVRLLGLNYFRQLCGGTSSSELEQRYLNMLDQVTDYAWYGNIRELQNFTERICILMKNGIEAGFNVMTEIMQRRSLAAANETHKKITNKKEQESIEEALRNHPSSIEEAARSLGYSRQTLWRKMKKYGISRS